MALYAVGDLQGCLDPLERLLEQVRFDPATDHLWLVGDLVNRGPDSLGCLRYVRALGDAATAVLGNHDLHLLATAEGVRTPGNKDTLRPVLDAPDAAELLDWLAQRPLLHTDSDAGWTLVHAGIAPGWDLETAQTEARRVEAELRDPARRHALFEVMYGDEPAHWDPELAGYDRLRFTINSFTRMRYLMPDGGLEFSGNGPPEDAPETLTPWFAWPGRPSEGWSLVFGHWAALGHRRGPGWLSLDSGCVWGRTMTIARLDETRDPFRVRTWQTACSQ
ncbi:MULTISPECIES: symmetrical bis(5'-nucleosyl)-tetraphosphatase [unclassified Thioalkalivibrio]|uniref:symmetrical bis(5'-nucleosyl)-tetraphosphatase n=1 Tax=unclassified Thioalkalivibrio TaxID=2621013 RepID=UPI00037AEE6F|nr:MULTISPECIES: symmetrical bis(5'-nucleosyl)-tetraphosphatase [unclassified Thioalkalivibrio]